MCVTHMAGARTSLSLPRTLTRGFTTGQVAPPQLTGCIMENNKKIEYLVQEFKKEGIHTIYSKLVVYSSLSGKFETECVLERYFKDGNIEDKFTSSDDIGLIKTLTRKLAELKLLNRDRKVLRLN